MIKTQRTSIWTKVVARYRCLVHKMANGLLLDSERKFMDYFVESCYGLVYAICPSDHRLKRLNGMN